MSTPAPPQHHCEQTIRQVRLDCMRALLQANFCPDRSEIDQVRCMDDHVETDASFGSQLWYFEGTGVDHQDQRHQCYGVLEYSLQFGLHEVVEDGVFDSDFQRERFRHLYEREMHKPSWRHPAHQWLAAGLIMVTSIWLAYLLVRILTA